MALNETLERIETGMSRMIGEVVREEGESDIGDGPEPLGPAKIELDMMTVLAGFARWIGAANGALEDGQCLAFRRRILKRLGAVAMVRPPAGAITR